MDFQHDDHAVVYGWIIVRVYRKLLSIYTQMTVAEAIENGSSEAGLKRTRQLLADELKKLEAISEWDTEAVCGLAADEVAQALEPLIDSLVDGWCRVSSALAHATADQAKADGLDSFHTVNRLMRGKLNWR